MKHVFFGLVILCATAPAAAFAECAHGNNSLGGSIGPGQVDSSRSYTIEGRALLTVAGAKDANGNPVDLQVSFPGHCQPRVGPTIACTVTAFGSVNVIIENLSGRQALYNWVCAGM